jgi:hypothetical protein
MATENEPAKRRDSCPHCGKPVGLRWWLLLPSNNRNRKLKCQSCGGLYDVSDNSKMASIFGGLIGIGPGVLLLGRVTQRGGHSAASVIAGTVVAAACFALVSVIAGRLTLSLVRKS